MRKSEWQTSFSDFIRSRRHRPFEWGQNDCCLFAADWLAVCYGVPVGGEYRGTYSTASGALKVLEAAGGMEAIVASQLEEHNQPMSARVGDIVLIESRGRDLLAICNGSISFAPGEKGLLALATSTAKKAWKV